MQNGGFTIRTDKISASKINIHIIDKNLALEYLMM